MTKKKAHKPRQLTIALNKRARHEYFIEEEFLKAGLALQGWEVKSLRAGKANISDSYVLLRDGEAFLLALTSRQWPWPPRMVCHLNPYPQVTSQPNATYFIVRSRQSRRLYRSGALPVLENAWCK